MFGEGWGNESSAGGKRRFAYEAHTACDKHGFVLETVVTPGNVCILPQNPVYADA